MSKKFSPTKVFPPFLANIGIRKKLGLIKLFLNTLKSIGCKPRQPIELYLYTHFLFPRSSQGFFVRVSLVTIPKVLF